MIFNGYTQKLCKVKFLPRLKKLKFVIPGKGRLFNVKGCFLLQILTFFKAGKYIIDYEAVL